MKAIVLLLTGLLLASGGSAAGITPESVLAQMNVQREAAGLPPLQNDERLMRAADLRMRDMEDLAYWAHVAPDGRSPFEMLRPSGYPYQYAGENLAAGFETVELLVESWMESRGHRQNILSPIYQDCGVAVLEGSTLGRASGHSVVVLFGRKLPSESELTERASADRRRVSTPPSRR